LDYLATHTSLSPIRRGFAPGFVNYKKGCTRLASDKVYQEIIKKRTKRIFHNILVLTFSLLLQIFRYNVYKCVYIRLKIKPNSVRIRFQSCHFFVLPSTGFEPTPLIHCTTIRLAYRHGHFTICVTHITHTCIHKFLIIWTYIL
jgi:hypothetical protein